MSTLINILTRPTFIGAACAFGVHFKVHEYIFGMLKRCIRPRSARSEKKKKYKLRQNIRRRLMLQELRNSLGVVKQRNLEKLRAVETLIQELIQREELQVTDAHSSITWEYTGHDSQAENSQVTDAHSSITWDYTGHDSQAENSQVTDLQILMRREDGLAEVNHGFLQTEELQAASPNHLGTETEEITEKQLWMRPDQDQATDNLIVDDDETKDAIDVHVMSRTEQDEPMDRQELGRADKNQLAEVIWL